MGRTRSKETKVEQLRCLTCQLVFVGRHDCPYGGVGPALAQKIIAMEEKLDAQSCQIHALDEELRALRSGLYDGGDHE